MTPGKAVAGALNHLGWLEGTQAWYWHIANDLFLGFNPFRNNWQAFPEGDYHLLLQGNFGDALLVSPQHPTKFLSPTTGWPLKKIQMPF